MSSSRVVPGTTSWSRPRWSRVGAQPRSRTRDVLLIGLAGGTVARQLTAAYGPIPITGVEIDPKIDESPGNTLHWTS